MLIKEGNRREIEARISTMGDYLKMGYLAECLKKNLDFDSKKFVMLELVKIYEKRGMFVEAGRLMRNAADINTTYKGKIMDFVKSTELFICGGNFYEADNSMQKALGASTEAQKVNIKHTIKEFYKNQAEEYKKRDKRKNAMLAYEKIFQEFTLTGEEREGVRNELLKLYEQLGKIREFSALKSGAKLYSSK